MKNPTGKFRDEICSSGLTRRRLLQFAGATLTSSAIGIKSSLAASDENRLASKPELLRQNTLPKNKSHNIVFIFTDQERFSTTLINDLNLKGHQRLQNEGTNFINHYCAASMCTSSRAVLLTGLQTSDNGMFENVDMPYVKPLSTKIPTIGTMLRNHGYYTSYKGKWHLDKKFETEQPRVLFTEEMNAYGFSDYIWPGDVLTHSLGGYQYDHMIAGSAISWLRQKAHVLNSENTPWALFISLVNPHDIMYFNSDRVGEKVQMSGHHLMHSSRAPAHENYRKKWQFPLPLTRYQSLEEANRPQAHAEYHNAWGWALGNIPNEDWRWNKFSDFYYNSLKAVDMQLDKILRELDRLNLSDNTIVVFTSDHGEMGGAHGLRGKGPFAYEESIHVPFIIKHPDVKGGGISASLTSHIDIAPSILSMCGVKNDEIHTLAGRTLPGKDICSALNNVPQSKRHTVRDSILFTYSGLATNDSKLIEIIATAKAQGTDPRQALNISGYKPDLKKRGSLRCVFDGRYKFSRYFSPIERNTPLSIESLRRYNDTELFDLKEDPMERSNISYSSGSEKILMEMNDKLNTVILDEFGKDDGREMPDFKNINWAINDIDL